MVNMIYCELLKMKRAKFFSTLCGICFIFPLMFLFTENKGAVINWNRYMFREQMSSSFTFILVFVIVAVSLIYTEFTNNTAINLYSYPTTRIKITISKIIMTIIIIAAVYILKFCITIVFGLSVQHEKLTTDLIFTYSKVNLYIILFQSALVPVTVFIASLSRNLVGPIIYGISLWGLNLLAFNLNEKIAQITPSCLVMVPIWPLLDKYNSTSPVTPSMVIVPQISILSAVVTFAIGMILCIVYYKKTDIA